MLTTVSEAFMRLGVQKTITEDMGYNHVPIPKLDTDLITVGSATEAFGVSFNVVGQEAPKALPNSPQPIKRFCSTEISLPVVQARTPFIVETKVDDNLCYVIYLTDQIGPDTSEPMSLRRYEDILVLLKSATETTQVMLYINSMGGCINWMFKIMTAIVSSKAQVTTIAAGSVMSAAAPIWAAGKIRKIIPNSIFMFHNPAHADMGTTSMIAQTAHALDEHIYTTVFKPFMDAGYITEEEYNTILKRQDVYITGIELAARIEAKTNSVVQTKGV